jgi:hypothetical protein
MTRTLPACALITMLCAPAHAQIEYDQEEVIARIAECMKETAPPDWKRLIFTLDQQFSSRDRPGKSTASHKAIAGNDDSPRDIKPCRRPDWVSKAVQTFRETQDEKARLWTGITVMLERDGRYTINYRYPK